MICEQHKECPFFNNKMPVDLTLGRMYRMKYCNGNKFTCARYRVSSEIGSKNVPLSIYPNMNSIATGLFYLVGK